MGSFCQGAGGGCCDGLRWGLGVELGHVRGICACFCRMFLYCNCDVRLERARNLGHLAKLRDEDPTSRADRNRQHRTTLPILSFHCTTARPAFMLSFTKINPSYLLTQLISSRLSCP